MGSTTTTTETTTATVVPERPTASAIRDLAAVGVGDVMAVGGKAANLGELIQNGFPVPGGFVVEAGAYLAAMDVAGCRAALQAGTERAPSMDEQAVARFASEARELVRAAQVPEALIAAMEQSMHDQHLDRVAVRSSATAEDASDTSFAGMHSSYTNVTLHDLAERVRDCWVSLYGDRAVAYRAERSLTDEPVIAVVVQRMLDSDRAGVMFTTDESGGSLVIEGTFGLGEYVVAGTVEPDSYRIDRATGRLSDVHVGSKTSALLSGPEGEHVAALEQARANARVLSDAEAEQLAAVGLAIEAHYGTPQDIEWVFVRDQRWIVQARPITFTHEHDEHAVLLRGLGVGQARASGRVRILTSPEEGSRFLDGEVLVAEMTSPDWVPILRRAAALITDAGGSTCHAAIVSRELGIPGVVGTRSATETLGDGDLVTVDAAGGTVLAGIAPRPSGERATVHQGDRATPVATTPLATRLYVNLAVSDRAEEIAAMSVDGVGLLRGEFLVTQALDGTHPRQLIADGGASTFVDKMSAELTTIAGAFSPRPVVYRTMDFRSNEFRNLGGGDRFEPHEQNPMIGFRGCFRYLNDPETFALELDAVAATREHLPNLQLMLPFVRTTWELAACLDEIHRHPLGRDRSLRIWVMAEVPSIVYRIPEYAQLGIHGVSIGSNDLTQLMLGVDRDSEICAPLFDAGDDAVKWAIERIVETSHDAGLTVSLCGQAPSDDPAFAEFLVEVGIDSISVNPDVIDRVRATVAAAEQRLLLAHARHAHP